MIEVDAVSKAWGDGRATVAALRRVSLTAECGQALALVGRNGAGKSTLVQILATLARPDHGRARVAGFDVVGEADSVRARIGVALQTTGIYPAGRVRQVLVRQGRLHGLDRRAAAARCTEMIELAGLAAVADRRVDRLSGGTRRRLDLCLALLHRPPVILLDEPTGSLDPSAKREIWNELARARSDGACILFASQDLEEVERLADRAVVLADGLVWRDGDSIATIREEWIADAAG